MGSASADEPPIPEQKCFHASDISENAQIGILRSFNISSKIGRGEMQIFGSVFQQKKNFSETGFKTTIRPVGPKMHPDLPKMPETEFLVVARSHNQNAIPVPVWRKFYFPPKNEQGAHIYSGSKTWVFKIDYNSALAAPIDGSKPLGKKWHRVIVFDK